MTPEENEYRERIRTRTVRRTAPSGKNRSEPPGVGGWLADRFLILVWPVLDAIFQSAVFNRQWQEDPSVLHDIIWTRHRQIVWTVCFIMSALSISAGVALWKIRRSAAVRYAIAVLWITSPGYYAVIIFAWLLFSHAVLAIAFVVQSRENLLISFIAPLFWTTCLHDSKRVSDTCRYHEF